jgi:hypothetical protein
MLMADHCSLLEELIVFKPSPNDPGIYQIHRKAIPPAWALHDVTNMTVSRKECLDVVPKRCTAS